MKLLAFETSSHTGSVALLAHGAVQQAKIPTPREQAARLVPLMAKLLADSGLALRDLDGIAFGQGPGSFTGLRIAAAVAQGLGLATGVPLLPVSSLAATAQGLWRRHGATGALVCVDAYMGECYWGAFEIRHKLAHVLGAERLTPPEEVTGVGLTSWSAAGSGFETYFDVLAAVREQAEAVYPRAHPVAADLFPQAAADLAAGHDRDPEQANPAYLRSETAWKPASRPG